MYLSNRKWVIVTLSDYTDSELESLVSNSNQTSVDTLVKSLDNTKAILKWDGDTPEVFEGMVSYSHSEILSTLATSDWTESELL